MADPEVTVYKTLMLLPDNTLVKFRDFQEAVAFKGGDGARIYPTVQQFVSNVGLVDVAELLGDRPDLQNKGDEAQAADHMRLVFGHLLEKALTPEQLEEKLGVRRDPETGEDMATKKPRKRAAASSNGNGATRTRLNPEAKITVKAKENPKRKGSESYKRFEKYETGMTVAEALKKGVTSADLSYDSKHEHISISR